MIDLYTASTPNGHEIQIMLEETGLDYTLHPVNFGEREQFSAQFLAINPNSKIPAIVDKEGPDGEEISIFESGAILLYLAEKAGQFVPRHPRGRWQVIQWLMLQMSGIGPFFGQAGYFRNRAPEPVPAAIEKYSREVERLFGVVDRRLAEENFLAGEYSIADIACFPWMRIYPRFGVDIEAFPNVVRWMGVINARPAVQRGLDLL